MSSVHIKIQLCLSGKIRQGRDHPKRLRSHTLADFESINADDAVENSYCFLTINHYPVNPFVSSISKDRDLRQRSLSSLGLALNLSKREEGGGGEGGGAGRKRKGRGWHGSRSLLWKQFRNNSNICLLQTLETHRRRERVKDKPFNNITKMLNKYFHVMVKEWTS